MKDLAFALGQNKPTYSWFWPPKRGKPVISCYISKELVRKRLQCWRNCSHLGKHIQGGGGGQAFFATAEEKIPMV